jgi:ribosome-binding ATPase YchF (GTP1/OBG family)
MYPSRIEKKLVKPERVQMATVDIVDIAGLVKEPVKD